MGDNLRRIGTALVAAPVMVGVAYAGGWWFAALVAGIGLVAQSELYGMARAAGQQPNETAGYVLGALLVASVASPMAQAAALTWSVLFLALSPALLPQKGFLGSLMTTLAGAVYPTGLLGALVALREARGPAVGDLEAFWLVLMTFFLVWGTDIFAYYVGKAMGRTKLAPTVSPNKTWEGSLGGLAAAALVAVGFKLTVLDALAWIHLPAVVLIGGVLSQAGDLTESQLKRSTETKDAGSLLPGHGGLFDRFDSTLVAAPLLWVYLRWVAGII